MNYSIKKIIFISFFITIQLNAQFTSELVYTDINGNEIYPYEILNQGKYIYLDFFSTSCSACNNIADEVVNAYETYGSNNSSIFFLGIDYGSSTLACSNFSNLHNSNFPIISGQDGGSSIFTLFGQTGYPGGKLISPSGEIQANFYYSDIINLTESLNPFIPEDNFSNDCNLINIISLELHNDLNNALLLTIYSESPYLNPYPSFYLLNNAGDTIAYENVNYYGLSGESTHILEINSNPSTWNEDLNLLLFSGFDDILECSFDINLSEINLNGCTDPLAYNYNIYANINDQLCEYNFCDDLYFELITSEVNLSEIGEDSYILEIPIINNNYYYLAYPMSELQILNNEQNNITCTNCNFNVMDNPWQALDTNYYNVMLNSFNPINYNFEAKVYLENLQNNGQSFSGCVFHESIFFNLIPPTLGCMDPNAINYNIEATESDGTCLYSINNCTDIFIDIDLGWSLVGFFCTSNINVIDALEPYINKVIILKDYLGNAYIPEWNFNGIGEFERGFGYQIKLNESIDDFNLCNN